MDVQIFKCPNCDAESICDWRPFVTRATEWIDIFPNTSIEEDEENSKAEHTIHCERYSCPKCGTAYSIDGVLWDDGQGKLILRLR